MAQRPLAIGLMLCEQVIVDQKTKRLTPVNCFSQWNIEGPISERQSFYALAILSSGHGSMLAELNIDNLDFDEKVFRHEFTIGFTNPLEQYRCIMRLRVPFPASGTYQASLIMDGESIATARFFVAQKESK